MFKSNTTQQTLVIACNDVTSSIDYVDNIVTKDVINPIVARYFRGGLNTHETNNYLVTSGVITVDFTPELLNQVKHIYFSNEKVNVLLVNPSGVFYEQLLDLHSFDIHLEAPEYINLTFFGVVN
jgi:hypothetical protein